MTNKDLQDKHFAYKCKEILALNKADEIVNSTDYAKEILSILYCGASVHINAFSDSLHISIDKVKDTMWELVNADLIHIINIKNSTYLILSSFGEKYRDRNK